MEAFMRLNAIVALLDRPNVDTDAIIPKQFLKRVTRHGFGPNLFDEWRYLDHGEPDMDCAARPRNMQFVLNQPRYEGAQILLARENFGCGSSREHAPWALLDFGIRAIIAPSFADIFHNNCFKNGLLPVVLSPQQVEHLFAETAATPGYRLDIDLEAQSVSTPAGEAFSFEVDAFRKHCLLHGLDDIGLSMQHVGKIRAHEERLRQESPWLLADTPD